MIKFFLKTVIPPSVFSLIKRLYKIKAINNELVKITGYFDHDILVDLDLAKKIKKSMNITNSLDYSKPERHVQAFINTLYFLSNNIQKEIDVLMIGYDCDTYDAQALTKIGHKVNLFFFDINPFDENLFPDTNLFNSFHYIQDDLRNINKHFIKKKFDYILSSRACMDSPNDCGLNYKACIEQLNNLIKILKKEESVIVFHVISIISDYSFKLNFLNEEKGVLGTNIDPDNRIENRLIYLPKNAVVNEALSKIQEYLNKVDIPWMHKILNSKNLSHRDKLMKLSLGENRNSNRHSLLERQKTMKVDWHATYFHSSSKSEKKPFYMSNILIIKKKE